MPFVIARAFGLSLLCFVLFPGWSAGQPSTASNPSLPKVVPPSPNAAALGKYGDVPVGLYTGIPNISVPLYTVQYKDITIPISLSYHAGGIRVDEEASRVGLGWVLNAGGVISRTIRGGDDFKGELYNYFNTDALPSTGMIPTQGICRTTFPLAEKYKDEGGQYDFEPDHYSYNFLGYAGKFLLDRTKNAVLFNQQKIRISPVDNEAGTWKAQTADGYAYEFAKYETYTDNADVSVPDNHKSSWYLTKVISPSGAKVEFFYTEKSEQYIRTVGAYTERFYQYPMKSIDGLKGKMPENVAKIVAGKQYSRLFLSAIDFTAGRVQFEYEAREDVEGEERLKTVKVMKRQASGVLETVPSREFQFEYGYFVGTYDQEDYIPQQGMDAKVITHRLKLLSVTEKGGGIAKNPYRFKYNEAGSLPAKNSFARDHWGYCNGKWNNHSLIPGSITRTNQSDDFIARLIGYLDDSRDVDPLYNQLFILREIEYPTKGRTEFFYEANRVDPVASQKNDKSVFSKISATLYDESVSFLHDNTRTSGVHKLDFSDMYVGPDGELFPVTLKARFKLKNSTTCSNAGNGATSLGYTVENPEGGKVSDVGLNAAKCNIPYKTNENPNPQMCLYCDSEQITYGLSYENTYNNVFRPGVYTAHATFPATVTDYDLMTATYHYKALKQNVYAGGLRIQKIADYSDESGAQKNVKRFVYTYRTDKNKDGVFEEHSSGIRMTMPQYAYFETEALHEERTLPNGTKVSYAGTQTYLVRSSDSNIILNGSAQGSTVGHTYVEVLNGEEGELGKTVYTYDNEPDHVISYTLTSTVVVSSTQTFTGPFPMRPPGVATMPSASNGQLRKVTDYEYVGGNDPYRPVKETVNNYVTAETSLYNAFERRPSGTRKIVYGPEQEGGPEVVLSEQVYNVSCSSILYFYPSIVTSWIHPTNSTVKVFDQGDAGKHTVTETEYFFENPTHQQVTRTVQTGSSGDKVITKMRYPADFDDAQANVVVKEMKGDNRYMHSPVLQQTVVREKDNSQQVVSSQITTFGYADGAAGTLVVPTEVALLRTAVPLAEDGAAFPPYTPAAGYNQDKFRPELRFEKYDKRGSLVQARQASGVPVTYLWGHNAAFPVAEIKNATYSDVKAALNVTAEEIDLGAGTLSQAQVEALQNNLKQAMITFYTYDPLVGMTSQTGPDGATLTYGYDDLGRLLWIKDHLGNLVKHYEYHYKQ